MLAINLIKSTFQQAASFKLRGLITLPLFLCWLCLYSIPYSIENISPLLITPLTILGFILLCLIYFFVFRIVVNALNSIKNSTKFKVSFNLVKIYKLLKVELLVALFVGLGFICFIVPGFVLLKRYQYALLIAEEDSLGPLESLRKSKELSMNKGWVVFFSNLFFFFLALILIGITEASSANLPLHIIFDLFSTFFGWIVPTCLIYIAKDKLSPSNQPIS